MRLRALIFVYSVGWLLILLLVALAHVLNSAHVNDLLKEDWVKTAAHGMWFAMLGTVAISFKGISDHWKPSEWNRSWAIWYLERRFSGAIVGVMTYLLLQAANTTSPPSLPTLAVAAFILGTQEKRFFGLLSSVAQIVLAIPDQGAKKLAVTSVKPTAGKAGETLMINGAGFDTGMVAQLGTSEILELVVSVDGSSAAGKVPVGEPGLVNLVVSNPDGQAYTKRGAFTYNPTSPPVD